MAVLPASAARGPSFTQGPPPTIDSFVHVQPFLWLLLDPVDISKYLWTRWTSFRSNAENFHPILFRLILLINPLTRTSIYLHSPTTFFPFFPLTKNSPIPPHSLSPSPSQMLTSRNATRGKNLLTQVCQSKLRANVCDLQMRTLRIETKTKVSPRRIFGEGTTSR